MLFFLLLLLLLCTVLVIMQLPELVGVAIIGVIPYDNVLIDMINITVIATTTGSSSCCNNGSVSFS